MITASVKKVDVASIVNKVGKIKSDSSIGLFAATEAGRLMQPYVPEREGILKSAVAKPWVVMYVTPYASYQYYGTRFHHPKPTATSHWDKNLRTDALARVVSQYIKQKGF